MYKILLCLRYLRTRYIALASIVSVMLGVATMIVVNSVMAGFSTEMRDRIHGILADVVVETNSLDGVADAERHLAAVKQVAGEYIAGMTATVETPGMLSFQYAGQWITRPILLIGIKPQGKARVGPLVQYLDSYHPRREGKRNVRPALRDPDEPLSWELTKEAMANRRAWAEQQQWINDQMHHGFPLPDEQSPPFSPSDEAGTNDSVPPKGSSGEEPAGNREALEPGLDNPFLNGGVNQPPPGLGKTQPAVDSAAPLEGRVYVGAGLISFPYEDEDTGEVQTMRMARPGDDVKISTVTAGRPPDAVHFNATVVDVFKSGMSEYDSNLVFCNLEYLQKVRGMIFEDRDGRMEPGQLVSGMQQGREVTGRIAAVNREQGTVRITPEGPSAQGADVTLPIADVKPITRAITTIQIKLKDFTDAPEVVERLRAAFPPGQFSVKTWEQKQGPLLAAVEVESAILNVLLFLIIAVAGFGILAIFFMIVVEKTRDIGILKALGAGSGGVMSIFLSYGLALGLVGSGVGVVLGLIFVRHINTIESWISWITGRDVFPETIYYFPEIPTAVHPLMVFWVALGAVLIAVLASILPARRAARLHPVEALRYE